MTERVERKDEGEARLLVVDPDDYRQTRQLKQIHKAKEKYSKLKASDETYPRGLYVKRIQNLILELEPLMRRLDTEHDYLEDIEICKVTHFDEDLNIEYSEEIDGIVDTKEEAIELAKQRDLAELKEVTGLVSLLRSNGYLTCKNNSRTPRKGKLRSERTHYSKKTCDTAFRYCREFITEADLGLQIEKDTGPAEI